MFQVVHPYSYPLFEAHAIAVACHTFLHWFRTFGSSPGPRFEAPRFELRTRLADIGHPSDHSWMAWSPTNWRMCEEFGWVDQQEPLWAAGV